jgi:hypothetical protein
MSYAVPFEQIKDAPNVIFMDDDAKKITPAAFEEDLKTGYRAGMIIIPVISGIQIQVAMMTPYHKDQFDIDAGFLREKYKEYCLKEGKHDWIPKENHEYFLGEVTYG